MDTILRTAGVTERAMYHHFENKQALGYAVMEEIRFTMGDIVYAIGYFPRSQQVEDEGRQ